MNKIFLCEDFVGKIEDLEGGIEVIVNDIEGVEILLNRISKREKFEWGTLLKVGKKGNEPFVIYQVLNPYDAEKIGIINKRKKHSVKINFYNYLIKGYNSEFHYHTTNGNYSPSLEDVRILYSLLRF